MGAALSTADDAGGAKTSPPTKTRKKRRVAKAAPKKKKAAKAGRPSRDKCVVECKLKNGPGGRVQSKLRCRRSATWSSLGETTDRRRCKNPPPAKGRCRRNPQSKLPGAVAFVGRRGGYGDLCLKVYRILKRRGISYADTLRYIAARRPQKR